MQCKSGRRRKQTWFSFLDNLDLTPRTKLCMILDSDASWKHLAGELGYSLIEIENFSKAYIRFQGMNSPTEDLLLDWSHSQPTLDTLYKKLRKLRFFRAAAVLKHHVQGDEDTTSVASESDEDSDHEAVAELPVPVFPTTKVNHLCPAAVDSGLKSTQIHGSITTVQKVPDLSGMNKLCSQNRHNLPFIPTPPHENHTPVVPKKVLSYAHENGQDMSSESQNEFAPMKQQTFCQTVQGARMSPKSLEEKSLVLNLKSSDKPVAFSHECHPDDIKKATYGFAEEQKVGQGSFGTVYRGFLNKTTVAVRRIEHKSHRSAKLDMKMLSSEVNCLLNVRHVNLVPILGYSEDGNNFYIVFDLLEQATLQVLLARKHQIVGPGERLHILCGAAEGLSFLHNATPSPVIHGAMRSSNILVDGKFNARLTDFGLAKAIEESTETPTGSQINHLLTPEQRTLSEAYMAPENEISMEADMYSFGVVMFECCTGEKPVDEKREGSRYLKQYIDNCGSTSITSARSDSVRQEQYSLLCDPFIRKTWPMEKWDQLLVLGCQCTASSKKIRPQVTQVMSQLNNISKKSDVPLAQDHPPHQNMLNTSNEGSEVPKMTAPNVQTFSPLNLSVPYMNPHLPAQIPPIPAPSPQLYPYFVDPRIPVQFTTTSSGPHYPCSMPRASMRHPVPGGHIALPQWTPLPGGFPVSHPAAFTGYPTQSVHGSFVGSPDYNPSWTFQQPDTYHHYGNASYTGSMLYGSPASQMHRMIPQQMLSNHPSSLQLSGEVNHEVPSHRHPGQMNKEPHPANGMIFDGPTMEMNQVGPSRQIDQRNPGNHNIIVDSGKFQQMNTHRLPAPSKPVDNPSAKSNNPPCNPSSGLKRPENYQKMLQESKSDERIGKVVLGTPPDTKQGKTPTKELHDNVKNTVNFKVKAEPCPEESRRDIDLKFDTKELQGSAEFIENGVNELCDETDVCDILPETKNCSLQDICDSMDSIGQVLTKPFPTFVKCNSQSSSESGDSSEEDYDLTNNATDLTCNMEGFPVKKWPSFMVMESTDDGEILESRGLTAKPINKSASLDFKAIKNCDKYRDGRQQKGEHKDLRLSYIYKNLKYEDKCLSDPCLRSKIYVARKCTLSGPQMCSLPTDSPAIYT